MESEVSRLTSHAVAQAVVLDGEQRSKLVAYARARFGIAPEDAEDLLQETALELLRQHTIVHNPRGFTFRVFHRRCCRHILETVSSSCRRILLAYYMEGRSLKETAEAIPTPYPGVWNTINRCLRRLRACLE